MTVACSTKWHTAGLHSRLELLLLTQKHSFNLGSGCSVGSQTVCFFLRPLPMSCGYKCVLLRYIRELCIQVDNVIYSFLPSVQGCV
jgi:hypothetical protein